MSRDLAELGAAARRHPGRILAASLYAHAWEAAVTSLIQSEATYRALLAEAERRTLHVSPPYGDERAQRAFLTGYEYALRDIASGRLPINAALNQTPERRTDG